MITQAIKQGLVITAAEHVTPPLEQLIACCGSPLLLAAKPVHLRQKLMKGIPQLSLFWIDDRRDLVALLRLLSWLRDFRPAVRRCVLAYHLPSDIEEVIRGANAHFFAAIEGDIREVVTSALFQSLVNSNLPAAGMTARPLQMAAQEESPTSRRTLLHRDQPP